MPSAARTAVRFNESLAREFPPGGGTFQARSSSKRPAGTGRSFSPFARDGGVLERPAHTEASVDLARLAGLYPRDCRKHDIVMITVADLARYRLEADEESLALMGSLLCA